MYPSRNKVGKYRKNTAIKIKKPTKYLFCFVSSLRAVNVSSQEISRAKINKIKASIIQPNTLGSHHAIKNPPLQSNADGIDEEKTPEKAMKIIGKTKI